MIERPNILFLMSDEHRADAAGYAGDDVARTPVLDELARTGVVFRNAYAPSPVCVPGRQCMMAGQLPRTCGCEGWIDLPPGHMTFARHFSRYAYETICCGKLHHFSADMMQGWTQRPVGDLHVTPAHIPGRHEDEFARYHRPFGDYKWTDAKEIKRAGAGRSHVTNWDEDATRIAGRVIEEYFNNAAYDRQQSCKPIMLKVSLVQPHYPYQTDAEKFGYYLNRVRPYLDQSVSPHPFLSQRQVRPGVDALPRELRRATAAYYGMVETIDTHYGEVLDRLRYVGEDLDDWIVVYTSDHGEMLGEHGIWEKQKFYEASARTPLIIRWPRGFAGGRTVTRNVSQCDLFATLCDLAGLPTPAGLDSRSLAPLLRGEPADWPNEAISQFGETNVMIKRDDLKYQYYGEDMPEVLFDLAADPTETTDFIDDPSYADAVAAFRRRLAELGHGLEADTEHVKAGY